MDFIIEKLVYRRVWRSLFTYCGWLLALLLLGHCSQKDDEEEPDPNADHVLASPSPEASSRDASSLPMDLGIPIYTGSADKICAGEEFADANGGRHVGTRNCDGTTQTDVNLVASNILAGVTIFGVTGNVTATPNLCTADGQIGCVTKSDFPSMHITPDIGDHIRIGKTLGGVSGRIKFCRSSARLGPVSVIEGSEFFNTLPIINEGQPTPFLAGLDAYDTVDDRNGYIAGLVLPGGNPSDMPFGSDYFCDATDWKPLASDGVTVLDSSAGCQNAAEPCMLRDPQTRIIWTRVNPSGTNTPLSWRDAALACMRLSYGQVTGSWRVPTMKDLLQATIDGMAHLFERYTAFNPFNLLELWSATSPADLNLNPGAYGFAYRIDGHAYSRLQPKASTKGWLCVHDDIP